MADGPAPAAFTACTENEKVPNAGSPETKVDAPVDVIIPFTT